MRTEKNLRKKLCFFAKQLYNKNLTRGTSGNISARILDSDSFLIKPSGLSFIELKPKDFVKITGKSDLKKEGDVKPSLETPFHYLIYEQLTEVNGIVHIHPRFSTLFSILGFEVTPLSVDILNYQKIDKRIPLAEFGLPGTFELAKNILNVLRENVACLMPYHGITTIGKDINEAVSLAETVEYFAEIQYYLLLMGKSIKKEEKIFNKLLFT